MENGSTYEEIPTESLLPSGIWRCKRSWIVLLAVCLGLGLFNGLYTLVVEGVFEHLSWNPEQASRLVVTGVLLLKFTTLLLLVFGTVWLFEISLGLNTVKYSFLKDLYHPRNWTSGFWVLLLVLGLAVGVTAGSTLNYLGGLLDIDVETPVIGFGPLLSVIIGSRLLFSAIHRFGQ